MLKANPKAIGGFVVGGLVLFVAGLVTFGSFKFFAERLPVVMYFQGDLSGLDVGAPLVFRGVRVGTITDVTMHFNSDTREIRIPVHAEIEPERFVIEGTAKRQRGGNLPLMVKGGLRAQLASQSLLTGKLLVQLDFRPDTPIRLVGNAGVLEIPTVPSAMSELQTGVEGVLKKVREMPLPELITDLRTLIGDTDSTVKQLDGKNFGAAGEAALHTLNDAQALIRNLNGRIDTLGPAGETTLKNADQTMLEARRVLTEMRPLLASLQRTSENADNLMTTAQDVIQPGSPAYRELVGMLRDFSSAARSLRALSDDLERNPDSIVFGKASAGRPK